MKLGILQGLVDLKKPPEMISGNMTTGKKKNCLFEEIVFYYFNYLLYYMAGI